MKKNKILLFGATGMAGHIVYNYLESLGKYNIVNVVYRNKLTESSVIIDVTDKDAVANIIRSAKPDLIVNCIGMLLSGSRSYPDNAIYLNAFFPHYLARIADEIRAKVIHISTDCVFSGSKGSYTEEDLRDADDTYGKSKGLGEVFYNNHCTLRTSIIGPEIKRNGEGLFDWFLKQTGEINGFTEAYWSGVTTLQLAKAIEKVIENDLHGLLHVTNGNKISKFELLELFREIWKRNNVNITPAKGKIVDKSLSKSSHFDFNVPSYRQMLKKQKLWMDAHITLYKNIYEEL